jgi:hypothetical protein
MTAGVVVGGEVTGEAGAEDTEAAAGMGAETGEATLVPSEGGGTREGGTTIMEVAAGILAATGGAVPEAVAVETGGAAAAAAAAVETAAARMPRSSSFLSPRSTSLASTLTLTMRCAFCPRSRRTFFNLRGRTNQRTPSICTSRRSPVARPGNCVHDPSIAISAMSTRISTVWGPWPEGTLRAPCAASSSPSRDPARLPQSRRGQAQP